MARLNIRSNAQVEHTEKLDTLARATGLSRSEHVNRAAANFVAQFPEAMAALANMEPGEDKSKPAAWMVEAALIDKQQELCRRLHISKDLFFRLALDYYFLKIDYKEMTGLVGIGLK